jgi:hypothetical protein
VIKSGDVTNQNLRGKLDPVILSFEHKPTGEIHHIAVPAQNANPADLHAALQAGEYV